jgi:tripartite-type tricarboxylate transporter receptor subunit TctC
MRAYLASSRLENHGRNAMRRHVLILLATLAAAICSSNSLLHAQLAEQPIRMVFPFAAGGSGDALARILAEHLRAGLNRTVVVENVTGAGGRLGARQVVQAAPDGNTILLTPIAPVVIHPIIYPDLEYNPLTDLVPISQVSSFEFGIAVGPKAPVKTLKELVAWAKANPKEASYGSPGAGALPHFFGVLFGRAAGIDLVHIGYRGSAPAMTDLVGGQIPIVVTTTSDLLPMHQAKRSLILATSDSKRSPLVPEVPTFREAGYDIEGTAWYGVFAPKGTSAEIAERYSKILAAAVQKPEVREQLLKLGLYATGTTPAELAKIQKADFERWTPAVKASGFKPGQ